MKLSELVVCLVLTAFDSLGQFSPVWLGTDSLRKEDKYAFPVHPGSQGFLAGTMGELRSNHFHAGIDIRTNNMEGVPIRAAMRGYVSRVIVGTLGYGKVVFVVHPNGQTTVYAHLSAFKGGLGDYIRQEQYRQKSFGVDLSFRPDQYPVQQGDTLAFSGNTGGSNGPHLHFEIRDSNNDALNPLKFNFPEIQDGFAPRVHKIALKTLDVNARINDRFGRFEFYVFKTGNRYVFPQPILAHGNIGVEILAYDIADRNNFNCGINYIEMFADSQRVFSQAIEKINFSETRDILAVVDFKALKTNGTYFNKLYIDDGNGLNYNAGSRARGVVKVKDKEVHITIELKDTFGNKTSVLFSLKASPVSSESAFLGPSKKGLDADLLENTLVISAAPCPAEKVSGITVFSRNEKRPLLPTYSNKNRNVYLIDLQKLLPDSVASCQGVLRFNFKDAIPSGAEYKFYDDVADIQFQKESLYDTLFLNTSRTVTDNREIFTIGNPTSPLHRPITLILKPQKTYPVGKRLAVYRIDGPEYDYLGGAWENGKIKFSTLDLGDFTILQDTLPPMIHKIYLNSNTARFRIGDALSGIASFEATVNGEWLLMNYDYKSGILQSERRDKTQSLKGDFVLAVVDNAGNKKVFTQKIQ